MLHANNGRLFNLKRKKKKILKHATVTDPRLTVLAPSQANKLRDRVFRKRIETLFGKSAD